MTEPGKSCVEPAAGPIDPAEETTDDQETKVLRKEAPKMTARVGEPAPDFAANAFYEGKFRTFKLSDYKGKWIVLCFYPGDFTFV
jgi:peroxiredoxin (alkyl hydroperoxide reductase subunit C)